jgi:3-dehydro-L-gulonate 2-dehydrogenase
MLEADSMIKIKAYEVQEHFESILLVRGVPAGHAKKVALEMMRNSLEGTYSHGINRFPRLVSDIDKGFIHVDAKPKLLGAFGAMENYDGQLGFGIVNAWTSMGRAIELARVHGIGCVAIGHTNHWLRAATYGYQACGAGMAGICFTNTRPNMPTWGALDPHLGNNPLVFAFPYSDSDVVVDMAMSQFSYGALEVASLAGKQMEVPAGIDEQGQMSTDPGAVLKTKRALPIGYWKGAALSCVLDIFAGVLSLGNTTSEIGKLGDEYSLSQVFIAIDFDKVAPRKKAEEIVRGAVEDLLSSKPDGSSRPIVYPGQRMRVTRERNLKEGIPVDERVWDEICRL